MSIHMMPAVYQEVLKLQETIEILRPDGAGDRCDILKEVGAACPNHYVNVLQELADGDATMVYDDGGGMHYDLYHLADPEGVGTITKIMLWGVFMSEVASENWLSLHEPEFIFKIGGTEYKRNVCHRHAGDQLANIWTLQNNEHVYSPLTLNPDGNVPWTNAALETLQLGCGLMRPQFSGAQKEYCTQLYVEIHRTYQP